MGGCNLYFSNTASFEDILSVLPSLAYTGAFWSCKGVRGGIQVVSGVGLHRMLETWEVYLAPGFVSLIEMVDMRVPSSVWWAAGGPFIWQVSDT